MWHSTQGIAVDPQEDNLFEWKCSIKGSVRFTSSICPCVLSCLTMNSNNWMTACFVGCIIYLPSLIRHTKVARSTSNWACLVTFLSKPQRWAPDPLPTMTPLLLWHTSMHSHTLSSRISRIGYVHNKDLPPRNQRGRCHLYSSPKGRGDPPIPFIHMPLEDWHPLFSLWFR